MPVATPEETISRYFAAIRAGNMDAWVSTFHEDAVSEDPVGAPPIRGHDALRTFFLGITDAFQRLGITEDSVFVCGRQAAVKWTAYGVGRNGREITFEGIDVFECDDEGRIVALRAYWEPARVLGALQ